MKTRVTELLGIEYPIIQGGMAWVAESHLAAAVSAAGGLGIIGSATAPAEVVKNWIKEIKNTTDKPFGINIMLMSPYADEVAHLAAEEKVAAVTTGAGNPGKYLKLCMVLMFRNLVQIAAILLPPCFLLFFPLPPRAGAISSSA